MLKSKLDTYGDILTPTDVHHILGIGLNKTYELLTTNQIQNFKIGRTRKIKLYISEPSLANILLKETPMETVNPSSYLMVSFIFSAICKGVPI